jgi:hypothetical protein
VDSCPELWTGRCTGFHEPMLMRICLSL